jgi:hypothetical protein
MLMALRSRRSIIIRAGADGFATWFGFIGLFLTAAALIWEIPPIVVFTVPLGIGSIFGVTGMVESYKTTKEEMLKAKEDDEKIDMVVRELQAKHDLANSSDFTSHLSSFVATTHTRVIRRRPESMRDSTSHQSSATQHSPGTVSRATTINVSVNPKDPNMQIEIRKADGGVSIVAHPKLTDSPSGHGTHQLTTPPPGMELQDRQPTRLTPGGRYRSLTPIPAHVIDITDDQEANLRGVRKLLRSLTPTEAVMDLDEKPGDLIRPSTP